MTRLGIELGTSQVHVCSVGRGRSDTRSYPWSPERVEECVATIRSELGDGHDLSLAIGLAHLSVQRVTLPPATAAARRQMLRIEPDRWFPLAGGAEQAVAAADTLAFACDGAQLERWCTAFSALGRIRSVEPAPCALARTCGAHGTPAIEDAQGAGHIDVASGVLVQVRRARLGDAAAAARIPDPCATARGAAAAPADADGTQLRTAAMERRASQRAQRDLLAWSGAAILAVCAAGWAIGHGRDRTLAALDAELAQARAAATTGLASLDRITALDREAGAITTLRGTRQRTADILATLGRRLPTSAVAQRVRVEGSDWQVDGNATTAAAVLQALAAESTFTQVRFLAPSTRFRESTGSRETYSIGFSVR